LFGLLLLAFGSLVEAQREERSIEVFRNMIFIPVKVAESRPLSFLLDTGTVGSMVSARQADLLHLKIEGNEQAYGVGDDTVRMRFTRDIPLETLGLVISPETIGVFNFDDLDRQMGRRIDGVIGTSIFKSNVVDLDYLSRTVRFFDPRRYSDSGRGTVVNLKIDRDGIPFVNVKIAMPGREPIDARLCVDTGGTEALSFNRPFVEKHHLLDQLKEQIPSTERGYSGESKSVAGRIESLTLGGYVIHNPIAGFSLAQRGATAETGDDGTIGNALLRRFHIIFNYARDIMILEPNAAFDEPFESDMSGLQLVADGDDLKTIRFPPLSLILRPLSRESVQMTSSQMLMDYRRRPSIWIDWGPI
jgi:hypothetical protein